MKQLSFIAIIALIALGACKQEAADNGNTPAQKNLAAARIVADAFRTGDVSKIDSVVAEDFTDHRGEGDIRGRDSLKAMVQKYRGMFPNMKMELVSETADSNYVFQWMLFSGMEGYPDSKMIEVTRFRDGKAIEHWTYGDWAEMMKMMQQPAAGNSSSGDGEKK